MANATVITTATLHFGSTEYKLKSIPAGKPQTCEAVDVTTLSDTRKQKAPGALTVNNELSVVIAGTEYPTENSVDTLDITLGSNAIGFGNAVVKSVTPDTIEAGGNREARATVVFQPCGADPS